MYLPDGGLGLASAEAAAVWRVETSAARAPVANSTPYLSKHRHQRPRATSPSALSRKRLLRGVVLADEAVLGAGVAVRAALS